MDPRGATHDDSGSGWIRRIVVAADGSPASSQGLEQVADLAARIGAKVTVVFVRHLPAGALLDPGIANQSVLESLDESESEVEQEAARLMDGTSVAWDFVVRSGSPGEQIVKLADESGADLVVVGSNRHSALHNLVLGSTAAYLTAHSRAPVLVMRSRAAAGAAPATVEASR
jgi:nucleotide-binding universal stress UspA family protein